MSLEQSRARGKRIEAEVAQLLKRYKPENYARVATAILAEVVGNNRRMAGFPPHHLIHSIEANCAYYRPQYDDPVDGDRVRRIINRYKAFRDPYLRYALEDAQVLELALLAMARQQFALQLRPNIAHFARYLYMFVENDPVPGIQDVFLAKYGFSIRDWMYLNYAAFAYTESNHVQSIAPSTFLASEVDTIPRNAVIPFLDRSSLSPDEIRPRYIQQREDRPEHLYLFIPSVFLEYPFIRFGNDSYLVVHPTMLLHHSSTRIFQICTDLGGHDFLTEFGASFEAYVGLVIQELGNRIITLLSEDDISAVSPGRVCDYLVEFQDCLLLIECKATQYSSDYQTEAAIRNDNSTGKIADAYDQMIAVAKRIKEGGLDNELNDVNKPVFGLCVTYGEILAINSSFYTRQIRSRMDTEVQSPWYYPVDFPLQAVSIGTFEEITKILLSTEITLNGLFALRGGEDYLEKGDWDQFTERILHENDQDHVIPLLRDTAEQFFKDIMGKFYPH